MKTQTWTDDTDAALADAATRYTTQRYAFDTRQRLARAERRFSAQAWKDFGEMGWLAVATPEAQGGLGLRIASICLLAEAAGRALINEPLSSAGVMAPYLVAHHGTASQREQLLPRIHAGDLRIACATSGFRMQDGRLHGHTSVVLDADIAERFIVSAGKDLWLVDATAPGVTRKPLPLLDGRGAALLHFDRVEPVRLGSQGAPQTAQTMRSALLLAALATAADSHGAMSAAFDLTLTHLKTRRQFGAPLGTYQALQHRAVDMYIALGESRAVIDQAIASLQSGAAAAERDVHAAKAIVCESARRVTQEGVQLHGGIGVTDEYAVSHYLRRARVNEQLWGSAEHHFMAFAQTSEAAAGSGH